MTFFISVLGMLISPVFLIPHQSYRVRFKAVCPPRIFSTEKVPPPNKANEGLAKPLAYRCGTGILPVFHGRDAHATRGFARASNDSAKITHLA